MIEDIGLGLSLALDKIASVPFQVWFAIGFTLAAIATVPAVVAWRKRRYLRKYAEKMASWLIIFNVTMLSAVLAAVEFVVLHGTTLTALGSFLPFWVSHGTAIMSGAILARAIAQPLRAWWVDRKEKKKLTVPDIDPATLRKLHQQMNPNSYPSDTHLIQPISPVPQSTDLFS